MSEPGPQRAWYATPRVIVAIVLIVIAIVFVAQNTAEATMSFLWFDFTAPVWLGFLIDVVLGVGDRVPARAGALPRPVPLTRG